MSKMDGLRAMREAKYAENAARAKAPAAKKPTATRPTTTRPTTTPAVAPPATDAPATVADPQLCGHRNMSGRSCTREHGHAAKSHRYS
ncbi:hypothetical protein [Nocardioides currus]|uniref:hypothetical protein n=1 Tax=Nocardioides currus TaxID=2133958 RepID=UPI0014032045|nr:hypothetical protein [Nocardioides currus]